MSALCMTSNFADIIRFGAVLEEFELRDAVANILSSKSDIIMVN